MNPNQVNTSFQIDHLMNQLSQLIDGQVAEENFRLIKSIHDLFIEDNFIYYHKLSSGLWDEYNPLNGQITKLKFYHKELENLIIKDSFGIMYKVDKCSIDLRKYKVVPL
jgi:hypothetical protein